MINYTEEDLYYACMKYCELFTKVLCETNKNQQIKLHFEDDTMIDYHMQKEEHLKKRLKKEFYHLCEIIDEMNS